MISEYVVLCLAGFLAGLIDAVVGGGGLIQTPALFAVFPGVTPATLLGTNKLASIWGTAAAAISFSRRVKIAWSTVAPAAIAAFVFSLCGAYLVTRIPPDFLRRLLPFVLVGVAAYTLKKKNLGANHAPVFSGSKERVVAGATGGTIGFYDGFFGPGTGSFLVFFFVRLFGFDFLHASAAAKVVNVSCNLAALILFLYGGHFIWQLGAAMAVCNIAGSLLGSRLAIRYGSGFVRKLFLFVVSALILKTSFDAFCR